jgi:TetR/AcrR family transcriptional regulator
VLTYNVPVTERPPQHRLPASDRRRQLLETALDLFSRKGFQGTTTKEIAAAAGVTEAIIFRHFPNKQALYNAVLDYPHESGELSALFEEWKGFMAANDDPGLFRSMIHHMIAGYRRDARSKRTLLFAALEGHQTGLEHHRNRSMPIFEPIFQYIVRRQNEGALRPGNPAAIIAAVIGVAAHYGMLTEFFGFCTGMDDAEATDHFVDLILHGVQPATSEKAIQ